AARLAGRRPDPGRHRGDRVDLPAERLPRRLRPGLRRSDPAPETVGPLRVGQMKVLRWLPWAALAVLPIVLHSNFVLTIFIFSFILGMAAVSFNRVFGFTGQLSMFHAAAFGFGAYITYLVLSRFHVSFWLALVPAIAFTVAISLVVGAICFKFKLKAFYFAVV